MLYLLGFFKNTLMCNNFMINSKLENGKTSELLAFKKDLFLKASGILTLDTSCTFFLNATIFWKTAVLFWKVQDLHNGKSFKRQVVDSEKHDLIQKRKCRIPKTFLEISEKIEGV